MSEGDNDESESEDERRPRIVFYRDPHHKIRFRGDLGGIDGGELREIQLYGRNEGRSSLVNEEIEVVPNPDAAPVNFKILNRPPQIWKPNEEWILIAAWRGPRMSPGVKRAEMWVSGEWGDFTIVSTGERVH